MFYEYLSRDDAFSLNIRTLLIGFASIVLMNAMAVLIITLVNFSKYQDQILINSNIIRRKTKGKHINRIVFSEGIIAKE